MNGYAAWTKKLFSVFLIFVFLLQQLFFFVPTAKAATNFTNTGFETDISGWSPTYSLLDQFDTAVAAGSVNGTSAEPTGGTRTVSDLNSKLSITGGQLSFTTGGASVVDPGTWYPSVARVSGKTLLGSISMNPSNVAEFGWSAASTAFIKESVHLDTGNALYVRDAGTAKLVGTYTSGANNMAVVDRTAGSYYFIKGGAFSNWTLLWISGTQTGSMFPSVMSDSTTTAFTADDIRIPTSTFIPTPTAYDTFTTASSTSTETTGPDSQSVSSLPWTGSTWTVTGGSVSNSPTEGSELLTNGNMETGNPPSNWTAIGATVITGAADERTGGSGVQSLNVANGDASFGGAYQEVAVTAGDWVVANAYQKLGTATADLLKLTTASLATILVQRSFTDSSWTLHTATTRATTNAIRFVSQNGTSVIGNSHRVDDTSLKKLTTSSLFRTVDAGSADALVEAAVTGPTSTSGIQGGLVLNLDSTSNPQNFIIVYLDGAGNIKVDESVSGTYTNKASTAVTYSAGATLRAIKYGNSLDVYYNNAKVGSTLTMTANTNTKMGLFSTSSSNTFDNFAIWPRSGYNLPDFIVSRSTTQAYGGSTASAKLVGGANADEFTQSVNTGDSRSYTLTTYAYTDGSAVTSSDLSLYSSNGSVIPTTYTDVGSGWYKLTGTVLGDTSAVDYGVQVQAGKTVYVDNMDLSQQGLSGGGGAVPTCTDPAPGTPTITSTTSTTNSIQLNFTKASNPVTYYALEYGTKSGEYIYGSSNIGDSNTTSYTINLLNPNTAYYFRVRAGNGCTPGSWSNEVSGSTLGGITTTQPTTQIIQPIPLPAPAPTVSPAPPEPSPTPISFVWPTFTFPTITLPQISLPIITWPQFSIPTITWPTISFVLPEFSFPTFTLPTLPTIAMPTITLPSISFTFPTFTLPTIAINLTPVKEIIANLIFGLGESAQSFSDSIGYSIIDFGYGFIKEPTKISSVSIEVTGPTTAKVMWITNHPANSKINYGESLSYGQDIQSEKRVRRHELIIENLKPDTKYYFEVMSQNKIYVYDAWHEFTTTK